MARNLAGLATLFYTSAFVVGIPALIAACYFGFTFLQIWMTPVSKPGESAATGNTLIDLLMSGARAFGKVAGFVGAMGQAIIAGLAIVSLFVLIYAIGLYFTGRGLAAGAAWGRILGILLMVVPFLASVIAVLSTRRPLPLLVAAASGYVLWRLR